MYSVLDSGWTVNGTPIYRPSEGGVNIGHDNIVSSDSGRDEAGFMHITWVRTDVRKVSLTYNKLTGNQVNYMVNLMQGKEFTFAYPDGNDVIIFSGYCGKITYDQKRLDLHANEGGVYTNVQINVVEM